MNGGTVSFCPYLEYLRLKHFIRDGYKTDMVVIFPDFSDVQDEIHYSFYKFNILIYNKITLFFINNFVLIRWLKDCVFCLKSIIFDKKLNTIEKLQIKKNLQVEYEGKNYVTVGSWTLLV
ncbi:MAG: hypothetical protein NC900_02940 [Candidatus Omnitrophica bacterium]|nr:hypothetical protein [Candidatus Omnitrophota bacterium]MCM8799675.1 hypothetical protein [Candidatus Omnitrophota bacterium]